MNLLSTIRIPKNLLYLTDRLPKPDYNGEESLRRMQEEKMRRRTYENSDMRNEKSPEDGQVLKKIK